MKKLIVAIALCFCLALPIREEVNIGAEAVFGRGIAHTVLGIDTQKVYTGFQWETPWDGFFGVVSLGGGYKLINRDLGTNVIFRAAAGIGYKHKNHRVSIIFDHVSNGGFNDYNPGINAFGVRYGYSWE